MPIVSQYSYYNFVNNKIASWNGFHRKYSFAIFLFDDEFVMDKEETSLMRFNWKKIIVSGTVAGMVIVTGCAGNVPSNNHGNRNGERLTNAVTRSVDGTRNTVTRGIVTGERAVRNTTAPVTRGTPRRATRATQPRPTVETQVRTTAQPTHTPRHQANRVAPGRNHAGRVNRTTADFRDGTGMTRGRTHHPRSAVHHGQPAAIENAVYDGKAPIHSNTLYMDGQQTVSGTAVTRSSTVNNASTLRNTATPKVTPDKVTPNQERPVTRARTTTPTRNTTARSNSGARTTTQRRTVSTTRSAAQPQVRATTQPRAAATPQPKLNAITLVGKSQPTATRNSQRMTRGMTRGVNRTVTTRNANRTASRTTNRVSNRTAGTTARNTQRMTRGIHRTGAVNRPGTASVTRSTANRTQQRNDQIRNANRATRKANPTRRVDRTRSRVEGRNTRNNGNSLARQSIEQKQTGVTRSIQPLSAVGSVGVYK